MLVRRIALRNYRVFEQPVELELPGGLVGIYGPNGAGKSYLIEAIPWTLWGKTRTTNDDVRTDGVGGDCVTEVTFEHEGHLYLVRRTVSGANHQVKALVHVDGQHVAEGVRDVKRYLQSILGMDDNAFRHSVFAEQKQVAAFSLLQPAKRKELVLKLLGIMPLDAARDRAKADARAKRQQHDSVRALLPDLAEREGQVAEALAAGVAAEGEVEQAAAAVMVADAAAATARHATERLGEAGHEHEALVAEGKAVRAEHDAAVGRLGALRTELDGLTEAMALVTELSPLVEGLAEAEARLRLVSDVERLQTALASIPVPAPPALPDPALGEAARAEVEEARTALATHGGRRASEAERVERANALAGTDLSLEAACPTCGQALGDSYEQVRAHRRAEAETAAADLAAIDAALSALRERAERALAALQTHERAAADAAALQAAYDGAASTRSAAEQQLAAAVAAVAPEPAPGEGATLGAEVERRREAATTVAGLLGRLGRQPKATADADRERDLVETAAGRLETLREKVRALAFDPAELAAARAAATAAETVAQHERDAQARAVAHAAQASARAEAAAGALAEAKAQHESLAELAVESSHLGRVADLLHGFRNALVGTVGPRLATQAAELFAELTDGEYDRLEVDPETYEIGIVDAGRAHGMGRFSGSEVDLANLALRVAISEHVRFQSGGQVGLLVLDEVFGPLDADRKDRMLLALDRLLGRFRQVLVVTHDNEIKEQLPTAIEVVKLAPRRATVRMVGG